MKDEYMNYIVNYHVEDSKKYASIAHDLNLDNFLSYMFFSLINELSRKLEAYFLLLVSRHYNYYLS
jgi:hypothetical protein